MMCYVVNTKALNLQCLYPRWYYYFLIRYRNTHRPSTRTRPGSQKQPAEHDFLARSGHESSSLEQVLSHPVPQSVYRSPGGQAESGGKDVCVFFYKGCVKYHYPRGQAESRGERCINKYINLQRLC